MMKANFIRSIVGIALAGMVGMVLTTAGAEISFANCGGHCQAAKMCGDLVSRKGVKGAQKRDEYQKCMRDPNSYK